MRIGLAGFQGAGKTAIFRALTGVAGAGTPRPGEVGIGVVRVPDPRLARLSAAYGPKKTTPAAVEFLDLPPLGVPGKGAAERVALMRKADGLACVVDAFSGSVAGAWREALVRIRRELAFEDLAILEKRIATLEKSAAKPAALRERDQRELALLRRLKPVFEAAGAVDLSNARPEEAKQTRGYQFFLLKPSVAVVNVAEGQPTGPMGPPELPEGYGAGVRVSAKVEEEIAALPEGEREGFLKELLIAEPASHLLVRAAFAALGLVNFFTVGSDEVRAWTVPQGATAIEAAGAIHSDLARGFIRAEVFSYREWEEAGGSAQVVKAKGRLRLEGKEYPVADGDVLTIRFSV